MEDLVDLNIPSAVCFANFRS